MKNLIFILILSVPLSGVVAQDLQTDSLTLLDIFYTGLDGNNWNNNTNWATSQPVDTWFGISLDAAGGRVQQIQLGSNMLSGDLGIGINAMDALTDIILPDNQLTSVADLDGLPLLLNLNLSDNLLTEIPQIVASAPNSYNVANNFLDFGDLQSVYSTAPPFFIYAPQKPYGEAGFLYLFEGDTLSLDASVGGSGNQYSWFKDDVLIQGPLPNPVLEIPNVTDDDEGVYRAEVLNSLFPDLVMEKNPVEVLLYDQDILGGDYVPNQLIVEFTDDATQFEKDTLLEYYNATRLDTCLCGVLELWELPDTSFLGDSIIIGVEATKESAVSKSQVEDAGNNYFLFLVGKESPRDPIFMPKRREKLPPSISSPVEGEVTAAIIDVGVDYTHMALEGFQWLNPNEMANGMDDDGNCLPDDFNGYDLVNRDNTPLDLIEGHGTHLAGIIVELLTPMDVRYMSIKSHDDMGQGLLFEATCGIYYAAFQGADIINLSWGYQGEPSSVLGSAIARAGNDCGSLVVASAGNEGDNNDSIPHYPSGYDTDNLISVAALDLPETALAPFSNYGIGSVDLAAPGTRIESTVPGNMFEFRDGTSMAAAAVTHAAVKLKMARPMAGWPELKEALLSTVTVLPTLDSLATGGKLNTADALDFITGVEIDPEACLVTGLSEPAPPVIEDFNLYPNPFYSALHMEFSTRTSGTYTLEVYNALGQRIHRAQRQLNSGGQQWTWVAPQLSAGWYLIRVVPEQGRPFSHMAIRR